MRALLGLMLAQSAAMALPEVIDFDVSDGDLIADGDPNQWEWGAPTSGPALDGSVGRVWATRLDRDTMHEADDTLRLPAVDLGGASRPVLSLLHWYEIHPSDLAQVELLRGGIWTATAPIYAEAPGWSGSSGGWRVDYIDLSGLSDASAVRLRFLSDAAGAEAGWYIAEMMLSNGDPVPPQVSLTVAPADTMELVGPYVVAAEIRDDVAVAEADVLWIAAGGAPVRTPMIELSPGFWTGGIPGELPGTTVAWWIEASDGANRSATAAESFRVYLPAPTGLTGPTGRVVATEARLSWTAPEAPFTVESYQIYRQDEPIASSVGPAATVPLQGPVDQLSVAARFQTPAGRFEGDRSVGILVEANVPTLDPLEPGLAWQGDALRLAVSGQTLLFSADDLELDLGEGVSLGEVDVIDVDHLRVQVEVDEAAAVGARDLHLRSGAVSLWVPDAFWVEDGDDRPTISRLSPSQITAGEADTLCLRFNRPLEGDELSVDVGEGVVVSAVRPRYVNDEIVELYVDVVVPPSAAPGPRRPIVDDGVRLRTGPAVEVVLPLLSTGPSCGLSGLAGGGGWALAGVGAALLARLRGRARPRSHGEGRS